MKGLKNLEIQLPEIQLKPGETHPFGEEDPRVRRKAFSWRMLWVILLVLFLLSAANVFILELFLKMDVFSILAGMGVGTYWIGMAFIAAVIIHQVSCAKFDKPMRRLSRAMRAVAQGDFTVSVKPLHPRNKFDYMDLMFEDFNAMVQELIGRQSVDVDYGAITLGLVNLAG